MGIRLATFPGHQLTAQDYALLCGKSVSSGIFYGCNVTIKDESTLHITTGVGIANGRTFDVTDDDISVELTGGGSQVGRVYVHIDLADVDTPAQILVAKGATLPALVQDADMNESTGVWDLELATFDVDAVEISNLVYTASGVAGGGGGAMIAPYYDATQAYLKDQIFQRNGVLFKCLADIAVGTPLVVDTNVKVTDLGTENYNLNQNLTQRNVRWNPDTKYYEVQWNGIWYQDRYFNPTWDGIVMDGGTYDSNWYSPTWSYNTGVPSGYSAVGATSISYNTNGQNIVTKSAYNNTAIAWTECVMSKAINVGRPCTMTVQYQYSPQGTDTAQMKPIIALKTTNTVSGSSCGHMTSGTPYTDVPSNAIASQKISSNSGSVVLTINSTYAETDLYLDVVTSMYDGHANNPQNTFTIKKIQIAYT